MTTANRERFFDFKQIRDRTGAEKPLERRGLIMIGKEFVSRERDFEIEAFIGNGSFGQVYRAVHRPTMDHVAIKVLLNRPGLLADQALRNEIQLAGKFSHPNVVSVLDVNLDSQHPLGPYIVMEFVSGGTLKKKLDECRDLAQQIPLEHAGHIMLQIAQGAQCIAQHLIHRDIKPDNILFDGTNYKITDFGISKLVNESTRDETFKGIQHHAYMAPENWLKGPNSQKLDIYSVGILFYEILSLKHPLEDFVANKGSMRDWEAAHIEKICPDINTMRDGVSIEWRQLLSAMTAKKPESRPDWETVVKVVSGAEVLKQSRFDVAKLVTKATEAGHNQEMEQAKIDEIRRLEKRQRDLVVAAVEEVTQAFDEVVNEFNTHAIFAKIEINKSKDLSARRTYNLPNGTRYVWNIFGTLRQHVHLPDTHEVILCAGYIGPKPPEHLQSNLALTEVKFSANVILVKRSEEDIYGEWRFASLDSRFTINGDMHTVEIGMWTPELFVAQLTGGASRGGSPVKFKYRTNTQQSFADLLAASIDLTEKTRPKIT